MTLWIQNQNKVRRFATLLAVLGWAAVLTQLYLSIEAEIRSGRGAAFGVLMYTGYFTLLTNIFCAAVASAHAWPKSTAKLGESLRAPWVISAATLSIVMVGSIYFALLRNMYNPQGINFWVNSTLHYVIPPLFIIFWWQVVPRGRLVFSDVWRMLAYPVAYLVYLIVRGEATGLYPYFFIDVPRIGYGSALINAGLISGVFALSAALMVFLKRR
ncbi:MAG: Pr6Pr family membrane protein [Luminiphilus sp.]